MFSGLWDALIVTGDRFVATLRRLRFHLARAEAYPGHGGGDFYLVARETVDADARLHARLIFHGGEDPATGSAAGCAASWMVANGEAAPDEQVVIEQGIEVARPSRILVRAGRTGDRIHSVRVAARPSR